MRLKHAGHVHNVVRKSDGAFEVDGIRVDASVAQVGPARFEGRNGEQKRSVFVTRDGEHVFAQVDGRPYRLNVVSRATSASADDSVAQGGLEAPMPGRVTRVAVAVGDAVKRGQELIVVEAMKMENALVAPGDGVVKSLAVKVGDMVAPGPVRAARAVSPLLRSRTC